MNQQDDTDQEPGSQPLTPVKYEIFAQQVARGVHKSEAFVTAGYTPSPGNAYRLAGRKEVAERIEWLQGQVAKAASFDAKWIKARMGQVADALTEIVINPKNGARTPGPMFNAQAGARLLELLGREQGIFKDKIELGGNVQVGNRRVLENLTPAERAFMREMLVTAATRLPDPANDDSPGNQQTGVVPKAK